jgi:hypothetical protein
MPFILATAIEPHARAAVNAFERMICMRKNLFLVMEKCGVVTDGECYL